MNLVVWYYHIHAPILPSITRADFSPSVVMYYSEPRSSSGKSQMSLCSKSWPCCQSIVKACCDRGTLLPLAFPLYVSGLKANHFRVNTSWLQPSTAF